MWRMKLCLIFCCVMLMKKVCNETDPPPPHPPTHTKHVNIITLIGTETLAPCRTSKYSSSNPTEDTIFLLHDNNNRLSSRSFTCQKRIISDALAFESSVKTDVSRY